MEKKGLTLYNLCCIFSIITISTYHWEKFSHPKPEYLYKELSENLREEVKYNFLYEDDQNYFFMEPKSFEQIDIKKDIVGEKGKLLTENLGVSVSFYNEKAISVELPNQVTCQIKTTDVALKKQTVSSSYKPAVLENGLNIQVPPFIEVGDKIIVDTRNLEYIKKI